MRSDFLPVRRSLRIAGLLKRVLAVAAGILLGMIIVTGAGTLVHRPPAFEARPPASLTPITPITREPAPDVRA